MFSTINLGEYTCSGLGTQKVLATVPYGNVVSVGFQNAGNVKPFYASQMFTPSETQGYWQVVNNSASSTTWYPWVVVFKGPDGPSLTAEAIAIETSTESLPDGGGAG